MESRFAAQARCSTNVTRHGLAERDLLSASRMARGVVIAAGALLVGVGILHDVLGIAALQRAVSQGELAQRLAGPHTVNWLFSGAAMSFLGVLVLLAAWELRSAGRLAHRVVVLTGIFFVLVGIIAYAIEPRPKVLLFAVLGSLLCTPVLLKSSEHRGE